MTNYASVSSPFEGDLITLMIFYVLFLSVVLLCGLIYYIFRGIGLYRLGKSQGISHAWIAWIPIATDYLEGELAGTIRIGEKEIKNPGVWMVVLPIIVNVVMSIIVGIYVASIMIPIILSGSLYPTMTRFTSSMILFIVVITITSIAAQALLYLLYGFVRITIYERYTERSMAFLHVILSMLVPMYTGIYYFVLSKKASFSHMSDETLLD